MTKAKTTNNKTTAKISAVETKYNKEKSAYCTEHATTNKDFADAYKTAFSPKTFAEILNVSIKTVKIREYDLLADLSAVDYEKKLASLSADVLSASVMLVTLAKMFTNSYRKYESREHQNFINQLAGKSLHLGWVRYPESNMHFGLHKNCKYVTREKLSVDKDIAVDKLTIKLLNAYPAFFKSSKVYTSHNTSAGYYYPNPAIDYLAISNLVTTKMLSVMINLFYSKCISADKKTLIERNIVK